jgi:hypothetical protein
VAHYNTQPRFEPIEKRDFKQTVDKQPADNQQTASTNHRHMSKASNEPHTPKNPLRAVSPPQTPPRPPQNHITPQTKLCPDAHPRGRKRAGQRHCDKNELRQPPIRPNGHARRRQTPVCAATRWAERHGKMAQHALGSPKKFALMPLHFTYGQNTKRKQQMANFIGFKLIFKTIHQPNQKYEINFLKPKF